MFIIVLLAGVYLVLSAMLMDTKNIQSFIIFKAVPFLLGLASIIIAVKALGWI